MSRLQQLYGIYRGIVRSAISQDDQGRMRVQVEVPYIHEAGQTDLPFAECCQDVGFMRGKFFAFRPGDPVWVMFEGGNFASPVVVGAPVVNDSGVSSAPIDVQVDQNDSVSVETDDAGNAIIFDGRLDKRKVIIRSGGAELEVSGTGDRLHLKAVNGSVTIESATANVVATNASVEASQINIAATASDLLGVDAGSLTESANDRIVRAALPTVPAVSNADAIHGSINDGGLVPTLRGIPVPPGRPLQSNKHNLRSRIINIGVGPTGFVMDPFAGDPATSPFVDYEPNVSEAAAATATGTPSVPYPLLPTLEINIRSAVKVNVVAPTVLVGGVLSVDLQSQALMSLTALADLSVTAVGKASVTVGGNLDAVVGGTASVLVGGSLSAVIGGTADLICGDAMSLAAPTISLTGTVQVYGPLNMFGPLTGMLGVLFDLHTHPYIDTPVGLSLTLPPV